MKLKDHYDWIVLGNHPGALLSAGVASKLGLSVLILPFGVSFKADHDEKEQVFDPESNYLLGISEDGLSPAWLLQQLGLTELGAEFITAHRSKGRTYPQVLTPESRLVLESNDQFLSELQRELGSSSARQLGLAQILKSSEAEFSELWRQFSGRLIQRNPVPAGTKMETLSLDQVLKETRKSLISKYKLANRKKLKDKIRSLTREKSTYLQWLSHSETISQLAERLALSEFSEVGSGLYSGITSTEFSDPGLFELLLLLNLSRTGASYRGGLSAFRQFLIKQARELGAHYPGDAECRRVFIEGNRFQGVQVSGASKMISGGAAVLGCSRSRVESELTRESKSWFIPWKKAEASPSQPVGWKFTLALYVRAEAIPEKMQTRAFWKERDAPLLEIEVIDPADYQLPDSSRVVVFLRTLMPFEPKSLERDYQRRIAGRMVRQATELIPFLEYHVTELYPDFRSGTSQLQSLVKSKATQPTTSQPTSEEDELGRVYGFSSLQMIPDALLCYQGRGIGPLTGVDKLYSASSESYPFLGSLGGMVSGLQAISEVTGRTAVQKRWPR